MLSLRSIVDDVIRSVESVSTDSTKFPVQYVIDLCDQYRAQAIKLIYSKTKRIHPSWVQKYVPDFNADLQDDPCCVKFWIPAPIGIADFQSGVVYTGTKDGKKNFRRLLSQAEYATYMGHRNVDKTTERVLIEGIEGDLMLLKVYGNTLLKEMRADGIWSSPSKLSTFNYETDLYNLCDEGILLMKNLLLQGQLAVQAREPADLKQDQKPTISVPQK